MKTETTIDKTALAFDELERGVHAALETYSNVHRGSGHNSLVSTHLFEQAREVVLQYLGLSKNTHEVVFCSRRAAEQLESRLAPRAYRRIASRDLGLALGVTALAVDRGALPGGVPFQTGGGTARLVAPEWVIWAAAPDRFEAGTPAIVNVIAFARALLLARELGADAFRPTAEPLTASQIVRRDELEAFRGKELLDGLRKTLIGGDLRVPTAQGPRRYVNLDNGASTPTFAPIWEAARLTLRQTAEVQRAIAPEVREVVSSVLGAPLSDYDVIFTSNTTEAINLVAESLANQLEPGSGTVVINTLLEHNSNELPWRTIPEASLLRLAFDADGFVDLGQLESLLREYNEGSRHPDRHVELVAVSGASNVLGVFNDLAEIARIAHKHGAHLLVDAAQLVAHRAVDMEASGIDYLAFSAHKAYAPFGTGVLVARKGLLGFSEAETESIVASGEENAVGIAALGKALVLLQRIGLDVVRDEEQALTARALLGMRGVPGLKIYGTADPASPSFARKGGVIPFNLSGVVSHNVARELAERGGIGVRAGCHCAHLTVKRILGIAPWVERLQRLIVTVFYRIELPGVARVSLGIENTGEDVDTLIRVLASIAEHPKAGAPEHSSAPGRQSIEAQMDDSAKAAAQRVYAPPASA